MRTRALRSGQRTQVWIADIETRSTRQVYTTDKILLEAPNWSPDAPALLLNGDGFLWRLDLAVAADQNADPSASLSRVQIDDLPPINNDHVLDADRGVIYLSANDGHIYVSLIDGGRARRVTHDPNRYHFLHGVSPDGATLAFVELPADDWQVPGRLALIASSGGPTSYPAAGSRHIDGPEYSPDGHWLYLNTEEFGSRPGHAQLARVPASGGPLEHLVESQTVDWFPHLSPDGRYATYVSFPTGTLGHPPDVDVDVRLVHTSAWDDALMHIPVYGGQGTMNVNSWSPDSRQFAFVAYPMTETEAGR